MASPPLRHVLLVVGDASGGIRRHVHTLIRGLDPARFKISYAYDASVADNAFQQEIGCLRTRLAGEVALRVPKAPHPVDAFNIQRLRRYVRDTGVDIIHGHGAKAGLYARLVGATAGAASVYTPHGGAAHDMFAWPMSWIYPAVERLLAPLTGQFVFESRYTAEAMARRLGGMPGRAVVNPNGIEPLTVEAGALAAARARLLAAMPDATAHVGVFGMLRPQKGQQVAVRALALLRRRGLCVGLHLFGDGPAREDLVRQARAEGVDGQVVFHGDVSPVESWLAAVDCVAIPSLFESFGYVAVEALMLERPVIASRTGGLTEVLDEQVARLVAADDAQALAEALAEALRDPDGGRAQALRGRERALARFSAAAMVAGVAAVYDRLRP